MTIFAAKKIYTLDEEDRIFNYLWVERDKIYKLTDTLPKIVDGTQINFTNYFIIPGFIESHCHILGTGLQYLFPNFNQASCLEEIFEILLVGWRKNKEFKFLIGYNLEPDNLKEKRFPTRRELDRVISDIPILLYRIDGHSAVLNTKGLEIALEGKLTEGVELDKFRVPTGIIRGKAFENAANKFRKFLNPDIKIEAIFIACREAIKKGITTMAAMIGSDESEDNSLELFLKIKERLPIEIIPFCQTQNIKWIKELGLPQIGGCILIDGSFGSHTAALNEDYEDEPGNRGVLYFSDEELSKFLIEASAAGLQTAVHAIGDRAINQVISCYEKFLPKNTLRHRIEHAELLTDDLIERIRVLGLILSVQPAFEHYWGGEKKMYAQRLGRRAKLTNPYRKLFELGITLCGGSDSPITPIDPVLGIKAAINHPNPEYRITFRQAFKLFTYNGAFAVFREKEIGMLKPGYSADFLVLSEDPFKTLDFQVLEVYKSGKRIYP